jgi:hypothetical protein
MESTNIALSKKALWGGRIATGLPALFLVFDSVLKLVKPAPVVEGTVRLGYPESVIIPLGIVLLSCTVLYLIPRTSVLGAILLTGYLGVRLLRTFGLARAHLNRSSRLFWACCYGEGSTCEMFGCAHSSLCEVDN